MLKEVNGPCFSMYQQSPDDMYQQLVSGIVVIITEDVSGSSASSMSLSPLWFVNVPNHHRRRVGFC